MDERHHKRWMAIAGLLVGLPAVAAGGTGAVLGLMVVWEGKYLTGDEYTLLLLWSSAGLIGLLSWLWLSGLFLWRGVGACANHRLWPGSAWRWAAWPRRAWSSPRCTSLSAMARSRPWAFSGLVRRCW